jgi:hypothetical protein
MNIEQCLIFDDVMFMKKQNPNEPLHLFFTEGVSIGKNFMLILLIQGLLRFYNKHPQSNPSKNITHGMH